MKTAWEVAHELCEAFCRPEFLGDGVHLSFCTDIAAALARARSEALEDAERLCRNRAGAWTYGPAGERPVKGDPARAAETCADAIRALRSPPTDGTPGHMHGRDVDQKQKHCSQCGQLFTRRACGPTHAAVQAYRRAKPTDGKRGAP